MANLIKTHSDIQLQGYNQCPLVRFWPAFGAKPVHVGWQGDIVSASSGLTSTFRFQQAHPSEFQVPGTCIRTTAMLTNTESQVSRAGRHQRRILRKGRRHGEARYSTRLTQYGRAQ